MTTDAKAGAKSPRKLSLDREVAMTLAATEYDRVISLFDSLTPEQWDRPTACPDWDVRAMAGHMLGMAQMAATLRETIRQQMAAKKAGGVPIDALTAVQVAKNAPLSTDDLVREMKVVGPKAARARRRTPSLIRNRKVPDPQSVGGVEESWTFGFLLDIILTRDPFMHRIDISRATGIEMQVSADHEGVLVDDVVREWAGRHGKPFTLDLGGSAGGTWNYGQGEHVAMDAIEFCRILSGREPAAGLLSQQVPF